MKTVKVFQTTTGVIAFFLKYVDFENDYICVGIDTKQGVQYDYQIGEIYELTDVVESDHIFTGINDLTPEWLAQHDIVEFK